MLRKMSVFGIALFLSFVFYISQLVYAGDNVLYKLRIDTNVTVQPDITSEVVEEVESGTQVEFLGEKEKGTFDAIFYRIKTPKGNIGWIPEVQLRR